VIYNLEWVYTNTHIPHEDFMCLLCLLITENKRVENIKKSRDIEKRVFGLIFFIFVM